ncbi:hypothetical protein [Krasilnikoviella flava]|uniref:Uncharacterized protein n=1 Tax=Krasilnikoviella flava TaxID=526729 RepID=A0A1T5LK98_9MICO|nr:hypothetical protein [Krasilnikoviella flava]SKC76059.1 hypothetical protein SAMN04324258_3529 [Krasilnikoviella flava]
MSRPAAPRPSLAILAVPMAFVVAAALLAGFGVIDLWVVYVLVPVAAVVGGLGFVRAQRRFVVQRGEDVDRLVAAGQWTAYGGAGNPEAPRDARSFPKRKPFESAVGHTFGEVLRTRVDGRDVWSLELGVQYRSAGTVTETGARESGPATLSDPFHVVLTRLDHRHGQVEVAVAGVADALRGDVEVGVADFDRAFRVTTESERTARAWLGDGCGADLARQGTEALRGGRLRLDGDTLLWWRKGHQDLDVADDVARLVARAAAFAPR